MHQDDVPAIWGISPASAHLVSLPIGVVEDWIPALIVGIEPRQQLIEANLGTLAADHDLIVARNDFYCISYRKMSALEGGGTDPDGSAVAPTGRLCRIGLTHRP